MDGVESEWTEPHARRIASRDWSKTTTFAKARVASSNPSSALGTTSSSWADVGRSAGSGRCFCPSLPISCPSRPRAAAMDSIRQPGSGSFELGVYGGTDPTSGRRRWLTRTVRGDREDALRELKALAAHANVAPAVGAHTTVAALLDQWFARGRATWSATKIRNLTSIVERSLKPGLGDILVGDLTTASQPQLRRVQFLLVSGRPGPCGAGRSTGMASDPGRGCAWPSSAWATERGTTAETLS